MPDLQTKQSVHDQQGDDQLRSNWSLNPAVAALINRLCVGALGQLLNHFLPTHLLKEKRRKANRTVRVYGPPLTPYARVLAAGEVTAAKKAELQKLHEQLNPFALAREVEQQKKTINAHRLLTT